MNEIAIASLVLAVVCGMSAWREVREGNIRDAKLLGGFGALVATGSLVALV